MINTTHDLSLTRQVELLELSRASLYYQPVPVWDANLRLMHWIDELHLELPLLGSHMPRYLLVHEDCAVERLWRSIKYEDVSLHAYDSDSVAKAGIARYTAFFNTRRPHRSFDRQTPDHVYFNLPLAPAA